MFLGVDVDPTSSSTASKDTVLWVLRKHLMSFCLGFVWFFSLFVWFFFKFSKLKLICAALDVAGTHTVAVQPVLPPAQGVRSPAHVCVCVRALRFSGRVSAACPRDQLSSGHPRRGAGELGILPCRRACWHRRQLLLLSASPCSCCRRLSLAAEVQAPRQAIPSQRLASSHSGNKSPTVCEVGGKHLGR